jgi:hypothetical protein
MENQYIKSKVDLEEIDEKQHVLTLTQSTTLISEVRRPNTLRKLDSNQVEAWIKAHPESCQKAVTTLVNAIKHVPHAEFESNFLNITVSHFNQFLKEENFDYVVAVEKSKSNQWMFDLATSHLIKQPSSLVPLAYPNYLMNLLNKADLNLSDFPSNLVLFDDAMFSGEQMSNFLLRVEGMTTRANQRLASKGLEVPLPNIILACAYATKFSKNAMHTMIKKQGLKIKLVILNHTNIPTVAEAIQDKDIIKTLTKMYWTKKTLIRNDHGPESRGLIYFDHKVADEYSFPRAIANGIVTNIFGQKIVTGPFVLIPEADKPYKNEEGTK